MPVFGDGGYPLAYRDAVAGEPGLRGAFVKEAAVGAPAVPPMRADGEM